MAERLAYLEAVVGADVTQFRKGMRDIRNEVGFLSETMSGIAGLGRSLTFAFTTPVLALGTAAINVASSFEASMYNINSIAGLSAEALDALGQKTLEFGSRTRAGAQAASEALYTVFSAGITNVDDAFAVMQVATKTAEAGLADLTTTTEGLVAILLSYGDTSEEAANRASDAITRMVALGVGNMQTFMTALSSVVPTASAIGMEFDDLAADMAFLTQRGLSASRAGVSMNATLTQMLNPTKEMQSAFQELGASDLPELIDQVGGVNEAIMALIGTADGDMGVLFSMFNSIQSRRAIGLFAEGQEAWQQTLKEFEEGVSGSTARAWEEQMKSFAATWDLLMSAVNAAGIAIGSTMLPVLQPFVAALTDLLLVVVNTNPEILGMGVAFLTVAAAIPPLLWLVGSLITPFGLVLGAVAALATAFATDFMGIATTVKSTVDSVLVELQPLVSTLDGLWDTIFPEEVPLPDVITIPDPAEFLRVERPSSLWEIYESQGYADLYSWDAFMEAAIAGGWDGGVINVGDLISIEGGDALGNVINNIYQSALDGMGYDGGEQVAAKIYAAAFGGLDDSTLWEKIGNAVAGAWPVIQAQIASLFTSLVTWIDSKGSEVISGIAGWFTAGAGTNLYTAFTQFLRGDFEGALNTLVPTLGTTLAGALGGLDIDGAFPLLTASLSNLFTKVKDWLLTTAIPTFSQGLGFLAGTLVNWFSDAVEAVKTWFSGTGASTTAATIAQYIKDGVLAPLNEGFKQATGIDLGAIFTGWVTDITTGFSNFTTAIQPLYDALNIDFAASGLQDLLDGVSSFMDSMADTNWGAIGGGVAILAAALVFIGSSIIGGFASSIGQTIAAIGDGIQAFSDALGNFMEGNFGSGLTDLGQGIFNFAFAVLAVPVGIIESLIGALNSLFDFDIPSLTGFLDQARTAMNLMIDDWQADLANNPTTMTIPVSVTATAALHATDMNTIIQDALDGSSLGTLTTGADGSGMPTITATVPANIEWTPADMQLALDLVNVVNDTSLSDAEREAAMYILNSWDAAMSPEDQAAFAALVQSYYDSADGNGIEVSADGWTVTVVDGEITTVIDPSVKNNVEGGSDFGTDATGTANLTMTYDQAAQQGLLTQPITLDEPIPVIAPVALTPLSASFASDLAGGTDVATIIAENFVPLEEAWVAMFAPEGAMATTFNGFSSGVALGWTGIETEMTDVIGLLNEDMPAALATFDSAKDPFLESLATFKTAITAAKDEVSSLKSELNGLLALESTMNVTITVTANSDADGSHKTGLMSVPYDGYMAELHKGEMVLTQNEANQYRDAKISTVAAMPQTQSSGGNVTSNQVTIQGNLTVDQMLYELKRRGIDLTKVNK